VLHPTHARLVEPLCGRLRLDGRDPQKKRKPGRSARLPPLPLVPSPVKRLRAISWSNESWERGKTGATPCSQAINLKALPKSHTPDKGGVWWESLPITGSPRKEPRSPGFPPSRGFFFSKSATEDLVGYVIRGPPRTLSVTSWPRRMTKWNRAPKPMPPGPRDAISGLLTAVGRYCRDGLERSTALSGCKDLR
jgi:hypothetical protein